MEAMRTVYCVYTDDVHSLLETHKLQGSVCLNKGVDLLLCDPLYNIRRPKELQNSDPDQFNTKTMEEFCDFTKYVLKCEQDENIFSSAVQLAS